jgi:hypothetical protein
MTDLASIMPGGSRYTGYTLDDITYGNGKFVVSVSCYEDTAGETYFINRLFFLDNLTSWAPASKVEFYQDSKNRQSFDIDYSGPVSGEKFIVWNNVSVFYSDDGAVWKRCYVKDTSSVSRPNPLKYVNGKYFALTEGTADGENNITSGNLAYTTVAGLK